MNVTLIDYGAGNVTSVERALQRLGAPSKRSNSPEGIAKAEALLLPGVGHYAALIRALDERALRAPLLDAIQRGVPFLGVCLGLQGIVEYFGGALDILDVPMHGKPSVIRASDNRLFSGLPGEFTVGRYHSLHARKSALPAELSIAAETADGVIMAIEHKTLPIAAVQFHPESIMTSPGAVGMPIIAAMLSSLCAEPMK